MAKLLQDVTLIDLGRRGEAGAQRVTGKFLAPLGLRKIAAHAGGTRRLLDEACHLLTVQTVRPVLASARGMGRPADAPAAEILAEMAVLCSGSACSGG